jgi:hypothetical protein
MICIVSSKIVIILYIYSKEIVPLNMSVSISLPFGIIHMKVIFSRFNFIVHISLNIIHVMLSLLIKYITI